MRKGFTVIGYFREHPEIGNYYAFCVWCYEHHIKVGRLKTKDELEDIIAIRNEDIRTRKPKFKSRTWFCSHYSKQEYQHFYRYCHYIANINFRNITCEEDLSPVIENWKKYKKEKEEAKKNRFSVRSEFKKHPEYGPSHRFANWHMKTYKKGTKDLPEKQIRDHIQEYIRSKDQ